MARQYPSLYARIVANTAEPANEQDCWRWTGRHDGKRGGEYGRMNIRENGRHRTVQPHRVMVELIESRELHSDEETVEHLCRVTLCCNPDHLVLLPRAVNSARKT